MGNGPRLADAATLLATALLVTGCSDAGNRSASADARTSPTAPSASPSDVALHPGRLWLVPGDGGGRCDPSSDHPMGYTCSLDGRTAYRFDPDALRDVRMRDVVAQHVAQQGWVVRLSLGADERGTVARVTSKAARAQKDLLLMSGQSGPVLSAPQVQDPIRGGEVQIAGLPNEERARQLVTLITRTSR